MADLEISGKGMDECLKSDVCIVDFFAEWCMPCMMMAPIIEEMDEKFPKIKFAKLNIDENKALAEKHEVMSIPTLIVFKKGKEIDRFVGMQPAEVLEEKLKKLK